MTIPEIKLPLRYINPRAKDIVPIDIRERPGMSTAAAVSYALSLTSLSRKPDEELRQAGSQ